MMENVLKIITTLKNLFCNSVYFTISFHNIEVTILPELLIIKNKLYAMEFL